MTFVFEVPDDRLLPRHAAGGEAGLADIWGASRDQMLYVDNSLARGAAVEEAYARRVEQIERATGERLENPALEAFRGMPGRGELATMEQGENRYDAAKRRFQTRLAELAEAYPAAAEAIGAGRPIEDDAISIARETEGRFNDLTASREGLGKWTALLGGSVAGALRDPLQVGLLAIGGGPGAGRTVATRLLSAAGRETLVNAGGEAALQPAVQAWRKEAGLPSGFDEAMRNVAFSGLLGGTFGLAGQGMGEGVRALTRGHSAAEIAGTLKGTLSARGEDLLSDNPALMARQIEPVRDAMPAAARGALDHMETESLISAARPASLPSEVYDDHVSEALRAAQNGTAPEFVADPAQTGRIADLLAPSVPDSKGAKPQTLTDFLVSTGGLTDHRGELQALGADKVRRRGKGSLVRPDGRTLDDARLIAAEAGFFNDRFGTPEDAMARSTVADFLDLLDDDLRTGRVTADGQSFAGADAAAVRASIERDVDELQRAIGPGLPDQDIVAALKRSSETGENVLDAWTTLMERDVDAPTLQAGQADILPGWEDADLDAMAARMNDPQSGIDDPARLQPVIAEAADDLDVDLAGLPADAEIPFDGGTISPDQMRDSLDRSRLYQNIVEACRA